MRIYSINPDDASQKLSIAYSMAQAYKITLDGDGSAEVINGNGNVYHIHNFECDCPDCQRVLYRNIIPRMVEKFNLPVISLPKVESYIYSQCVAKAPIAKSSVLSGSNPFKLLDVNLTDSKKTIMEKVMRLIAESPMQMSTFRKSQSELFNPEKRFLHHYFHFLAGQDNQLDIQIDGDFASARHAQILVDPNEPSEGYKDIVLEDLDSTNGILVNDKQVKRCQLKPNDVITIARKQFKLLDDCESGSQTAVDHVMQG